LYNPEEREGIFFEAGCGADGIVCAVYPEVTKGRTACTEFIEVLGVRFVAVQIEKP